MNLEIPRSKEEREQQIKLAEEYRSKLHLKYVDLERKYREAHKRYQDAIKMFYLGERVRFVVRIDDKRCECGCDCNKWIYPNGKIVSNKKPGYWEIESEDGRIFTVQRTDILRNL